MDYGEAREVLFGLRRYPPRPGTAATADLLGALGDPHDGLDCVQVAGSNGKGTTARMVESTLREAGASVGLYTSPHLEDVRERVRVDGRQVAKQAVAAFVEAAEDRLRGRDGDPPTFFEAMTALALWEFDRRDVDVAVLEVGIGGRYDATSVVDPVAAAVTSVTLEHTEFLGETVEEIARDKAHVAPGRGPLVTATDGEALVSVREVADEVVTVGSVGGRGPAHPDVRVTYGGRVDHVEASVTLESGRARADAEGDDLLGDDWRVETRIPTPGAHQAENAGVAAALVRAVVSDDRVTFDVDPDFDLTVRPGTLPTVVVGRGLRRARWPGRFEALSTAPLFVLDGAHNPGACKRLSETLAEYEFDDLHLVLGALVDKDHRGMVEALPRPASVHTCRPPIDRGEHASTLAGSVAAVHGKEVVSAVESVGTAVDRALSAADDGDCVLVTGSQHVVGEARRRWSAVDRRPRVDDSADADRVVGDSDVAPPERGTMADAVLSRTLCVRLSTEQARQLERLAVEADLSARVTGPDDDEEPRTVLLSGSVERFRTLIRRLEEPAGHGIGGLSSVAERLRRALADDLGDGDDADDGSADRPLGPATLPGAVTQRADALGVEAIDVGVGTGDRDSVDEDRLPWLSGETPAIMGILNITPDSFHDGGEYDAVEEALERAERLVEAGVGMLDVGGESTRPGADPVAVRREVERVRPVVEAIRDAGIDLPVSVDTRKAPVARAALEAGADVVNDVSGLEDPDLPRVAAEYDAGLVVMHSLAAPVDPDRTAEYDDVVRETTEWLRERVLFAERVGVDRDRIVVDPGLGFGKASEESFELLDRLEEFRTLGCPVLIGHSHKSMFELAGYDAGERLEPTVAATALAVDRGADLVRVHDAPENVAALRTAVATGRAGSSER